MTEVQSMTGFASATHVGDGLEASCDIRSVNNKGLDIRLRLPGGLEALEAAIKKLAGVRLARGSILITLSARSTAAASQRGSRGASNRSTRPPTKAA